MNDIETVRAWLPPHAAKAHVALDSIEREIESLQRQVESHKFWRGGILKELDKRWRVVEAARRVSDEHPDGVCDAGNPGRPESCPDLNALREALGALDADRA